LRILLTGATGFIGRHVAAALERAGHSLICAVRDPHAARKGWPVAPGHAPRQWVGMDFTRALDAAAWRRWVEQVDVVINTVGIVRESAPMTGPKFRLRAKPARLGPGQGFDQIHHRGPSLLFAACALAGVRRVIHVSALGADEHASSRYHLSKRAGDEALLALGIDAVVLQPSLVFGLDGQSAQFFLQLAALPAIPVPQGAGAVQPVHVDDLVALVVRLVEGAGVRSPRLAVVGPEALPYAEYLQRLRQALGLGRAKLFCVPRGIVDMVARIGRHVPGSLLEPETWQMLQRGNTAPVDAFADCLGRQPRPVASFIGAPERDAAAIQARLRPPLTLLRWSIAAVWLGTGVVSLGLYPVEDSLALLARVGAQGWLAQLLLYGAAGLDLLLGVLTLWRPSRALWCAQLGLIGLYTLLISWRLPEFWLHPYAPMLKNLPILAALTLLLALEKER
jgi:uncharacterized protein YbjT (DUF2867 family)